jgi:Protein of unknown function (DUF3102)
MSTPQNADARREGGRPVRQETALRTTDSTADLAAQINAEHEAAFGKAREALEHARRAGELLLQAKGAVGHGKWLPWLKTNCKFSERTAQAYMRLASQWDRLQSKSAAVADLPLRDALELLADKSPPSASVLLPEERRMLETVRAAGGCADHREVLRLQLRLMYSAFNDLTAAIDEGISDFSADELRHALECLDDCVRILNDWQPEDVAVGVLGVRFNRLVIEHAATIRRALEAAA